MDEIRKWNENLAYHKEIQCDFWVGIYYPNVYDNFEFYYFTLRFLKPLF